MVGIDSEAEKILEQQSQISEQIVDLSRILEDYCERLNLDPNQMKKID